MTGPPRPSVPELLAGRTCRSDAHCPALRAPPPRRLQSRRAGQHRPCYYPGSRRGKPCPPRPPPRRLPPRRPLAAPSGNRAGERLYRDVRQVSRPGRLSVIRPPRQSPPAYRGDRSSLPYVSPRLEDARPASPVYRNLAGRRLLRRKSRSLRPLRSTMYSGGVKLSPSQAIWRTAASVGQVNLGHLSLVQAATGTSSGPPSARRGMDQSCTCVTWPEHTPSGLVSAGARRGVARSAASTSARASSMRRAR
jgi:hypothetical protein